MAIGQLEVRSVVEVRDIGLGDRVARNLVVLRHRSGLTQQQLAESAGVSRATVHLIESGQGDPRVSTVELLARALGVDAHDLIEDYSRHD